MTRRLRRLPTPAPLAEAAGGLVAVLFALATAAAILALTGKPVGDSFYAMYAASFGTPAGWEAALTRATPLALTALAVTTALRMQLWNVGGEGQLLAGAVGATGVALAMPEAPSILLIPTMVAAAVLSSCVWALMAAVPRALLNVNEIVVTLFLNYIAVRVVSVLVYGVWKDPGAVGFAYSRPIAPQARIGDIANTSVSWGTIIVLVVAGALWLLLDRSRWGFGIDIAGGNPRLSSYLGFSHKRRVIATLGLSGAMAGIAGFIQLTSSTARLQPDLAGGYGYTGILVAFLAGRRIPLVLLVAVLFGGLAQGGLALQSQGVPSAIANVIQALVIFFVLIARVLTHYRWDRTGTNEAEVQGSIGDPPSPGSAHPERTRQPNDRSAADKEAPSWTS